MRPAAGLRSWERRRSYSRGIIGRNAVRGFLPDGRIHPSVATNSERFTRQHPGHYLAEDYDVPAYYLEDYGRWQWSNAWCFAYMEPGTNRALKGLAAYRAAIQEHYFSLVILDFGDTASTDKAITPDIREAATYHVIAEALLGQVR